MLRFLRQSDTDSSKHGNFTEMTSDIGMNISPRNIINDQGDKNKTEAFST